MSVAACGRCETVATVKRRLDDGTPLCRTCWRRDPASWQRCTGCGRDRPVNARDEAGDPVCGSCYRQQWPKRTCNGCDRQRRIVSRAEGGSWCETCYRQVRPRRLCGGCGRTIAINRRGRDGTPDLCAACNFAPIAVCSRCAVEAMCRRAGRTGPPVCLRCLATLELDRLLTGPDGTIDPAFERLRTAFAQAPEPRSVTGWLQRSPGARLLSQLASGEVALTHASLDALPQTASLHHLRQLLVTSGVLDERDPQLGLLEHTAARHATTLTGDAHRHAFLTYATWRELAGLRRRYPDGDTPPLASTGTHGRLASAARFLAHLTDRDVQLATLTQADIDHWIAAHPTQRRGLRNFIVHATRHGFAPPELEVPVLTTELTTRPLDPDLRWSLARRLLHDETCHPADRVVGLLVVLYAQPVARIARLTLDDITDQGTALTICFGKDHVEIPEPLAGLMRQLPSRRQIGPSGTVAQADRWLFPGRQAGLPIHPSTLARRLHRLGIDSRATRHAAMLQLASELPAAVLADILNIGVSTATRWAAHAGTSWNSYAGQRARQALVEQRELPPS